MNNYVYAVYVDTTSKDEMTVSFARLNIGTDTIKISSTEVANTYTEIKKNFRKEIKLTFLTVTYFPSDCYEEAKTYAVNKLIDNASKIKA